MTDDRRNIILVDDQVLFRDGIAGILEVSGHQVIASLETYKDGSAYLENNRIDIVIFELMNGKDEIGKFINKVKSISPDTRLIVLTNFEEDYFLDLISMGVDGYLHKDISTGEFVEMVGKVSDGDAAISSNDINRLVRRYKSLRKRHGQDRQKLTKKEIETIRLIAQGYSNTEIAELLFVSINTIKFHIRNIYTKLEVRNRTEAVIRAHSEGIINIANDQYHR